MIIKNNKTTSHIFYFMTKLKKRNYILFFYNAHTSSTQLLLIQSNELSQGLPAGDGPQ